MNPSESLQKKLRAVEALMEEIALDPKIPAEFQGADIYQAVRKLLLKVDPSDFSERENEAAHAIGKKILQAREESQITQVQLAQKLKITQGQLSKIENGKKVAPQEMIQRIGKICAKDYDWFFE